MKALNCPYLTRYSVGHVRQYANELLTMADRCPIMGHVMKHVSTSDAAAAGASSGKCFIPAAACLKR